MLLKYSQAQKRIRTTAIGKPQRAAGGMVKLTTGLMTVSPKIHRKVIKVASKRPAAILRAPTAVKREQNPVDPCDNSNDSGLGFDHHLDYHHPPHPLANAHPALRFSDKEVVWQTEESPELKRRRLEIKLESDDANDNFTFPETLRQPPVPRAVCVPVRVRRALPVTLTSQLSTSSQNGLAQLVIACQPETQHRARYQTEGSRGAVKDRSGNGFPVVKLVGYDRPATLQVFIGTDQGRVAPHMFYQACRVSGKNSTPCAEKKVDGTIVIEVDIEPSKDMIVTCDCVGILKERNVDVEHRFPEEGSGRSKKKSTRCRMVFRTTITNPDGTQETLQVTSQPIVCTQPPGVPEVCKKSLSSCSVRGGQELFVLGKNFLKDTRVLFQEGEVWSQSVQPDKEFLQQSHLVCVVPAYRTTDIKEPVTVRLVIESSGKASEPHTFTYLPDNNTTTTLSPQPHDNNTVLSPDGSSPASGGSVAPSVANVKYVVRAGYRASPLLARRRYKHGGSPGVFCPPNPPASPHMMPPAESVSTAPFLATQTSPQSEEKVHPVMMWDKCMDVMMPPPAMALPLAVRRSSVQMIVPEPLSPEDLKREVVDPLEQQRKSLANASDLSSTRPPSMDTFHRFVSKNSLPSINVGNYLSNIESKSVFTKKLIKSQMMNEMPQIMIPSPVPMNKPMMPCDSSNLLTTVEPILINQHSGVVFDGRNLSVSPSTSHSLQENLSVIVSSTLIQKKSPNPHLPESQSTGMDMLMSNAMTKQEPTMAERLDAFVNSAADSHISPTPMSMSMNSTVTESSAMNSISEIVVSGSNDMNKLQEANVLAMQTPVMPINLSSSHQAAGNITEGSMCSVMNSPPSHNQTQGESISQSSIENQMNSQNVNTCQTDIMCSPHQHSVNQTQAFSNLQVTLEEHLSSQPLASSQMNQELNCLMQPQTSAANLQSAMDQVSSQIMSSAQMSHAEMNNIMHSPPQDSSNQVQSLQNLQVSLEQQLSSQTMSSAQMSHCGLSNHIPCSPPTSMAEVQILDNIQVSLEHHIATPVVSCSVELRQGLNSEHGQHNNMAMNNLNTSQVNEAQTYSNLQASLEHLNSQITCEQMTLHSESLRPNHMVLNGIENAGESSAQSSAREALSNYQASLQHHLSPQMIASSQADHESVNSALNSLSSSVQTSPQMQAAVNQAQVFTSLQASLSPQAGSPEQPMLNALTPNCLHSSVDTPQVVPSQAQALSNIQMSFVHLNSQALTSAQQNFESTTGSISVDNSIHTGSVIQVSVGQDSQVLSNLSASLAQHITAGVMTPSQSEALDRQTTLQLSSVHVPMQPQSSLQATLDHFSAQACNKHTESLTSSNFPSNDPSPSPVVLSPTSARTGVQIGEASSAVPQSLSTFNSSVMATSPMDLQMRTSQSTAQFGQMSASEKKDSASFVVSQPEASLPAPRKCEEGMPVPHELTQMSETDLISYINPSCFDTV